MISINITPSNAEELEKMIVVLRREGLLSSQPSLAAVPQTKRVVVGRSPRATKSEMRVREQVDTLNNELGNPSVNWSDIEARTEALHPYGFKFNGEAFSFNGETPEESSEVGETFGGKIDLGNIPV